MSAVRDFGPVRFDRIGANGDICRLTLNRPERGNALASDMVEALLDALDAAEPEPCGTLLFEGAGKGFCGGFDLGGLERETDASLLARFVRIEMMLQRIATFPKRTVVYAQGFAFGAGADLLAACDIRLAAPDCLVSFPGARFGIVLGTQRLSTRLGAEAARALIEAPGPVRAAEAGQLLSGLVAPADWPDFQSQTLAPTGVDTATRTALLPRLRPVMNADADLAALVRSAARPGLAARLVIYAATRRAAGKSRLEHRTGK